MGRLVAQAGKIDHPTDDPSLPSFVHPGLKEVTADLEMVRDCWDLLREAKAKYLPKEPKEPQRAYQGRVMRSKYPAFYRDGVVGFAGALSRWSLRSAPTSFEAAQDNIDGEGTSLKAFLLLADALVLRDQGCLLMVDMPKSLPDSRGDEKALRRRPLLTMAERSSVLNWRTTKVAGREVPMAVTVREFHEVEVGGFGVEVEPRYRVMEGGTWRLIRLVAGKGRGRTSWAMEVVEEGVFTGAGSTPLTAPPVVWYSGAVGGGFGRGLLMLQSLAELSLAWYRKDSDQEELLHRCALPVGVRKGVPGAMGADGQVRSAPLEIGPNSIVDIPNADGDFRWEEISGSSLELREKSLERLEGLMDRQTLAFLMSGSANDRTATEAILAGAQLTASLAGVAEAKASVIQSVMALWAEMAGEQLPGDAGLAMEKGLVEKPIDIDTLRETREWFNAQLLRRGTAVSVFGRAGLLPQGVTAEDEAAGLQEEERAREEEEGETPDLNDPDGWDVPGAGPKPGAESSGQQ